MFTNSLRVGARDLYSLLLRIVSAKILVVVEMREAPSRDNRNRIKPEYQNNQPAQTKPLLIEIFFTVRALPP